MNETQCAPKQLDIPEHLESLGYMIGNLESRIGELSKRLQPVVIEQDSKNGGSAQALNKAMSKVAEEIDGYTDRIRQIDGLLYSLMEGLQI